LVPGAVEDDKCQLLERRQPTGRLKLFGILAGEQHAIIRGRCKRPGIEGDITGPVVDKLAVDEHAVGEFAGICGLVTLAVMEHKDHPRRQVEARHMLA